MADRLRVRTIPFLSHFLLFLGSPLCPISGQTGVSFEEVQAYALPEGFFPASGQLLGKGWSLLRGVDGCILVVRDQSTGKWCPKEPGTEISGWLTSDSLYALTKGMLYSVGLDAGRDGVYSIPHKLPHEASVSFGARLMILVGRPSAPAVQVLPDRTLSHRGPELPTPVALESVDSTFNPNIGRWRLTVVGPEVTLSHDLILDKIWVLGFPDPGQPSSHPEIRTVGLAIPDLDSTSFISRPGSTYEGPSTPGSWVGSPAFRVETRFFRGFSDLRSDRRVFLTFDGHQGPVKTSRLVAPFAFFGPSQDGRTAAGVRQIAAQKFELVVYRITQVEEPRGAVR